MGPKAFTSSAFPLNLSSLVSGRWQCPLHVTNLLFLNILARKDTQFLPSINNFEEKMLLVDKLMQFGKSFFSFLRTPRFSYFSNWQTVQHITKSESKWSFGYKGLIRLDIYQVCLHRYPILKWKKYDSAWLPQNCKTLYYLTQTQLLNGSKQSHP